MSKEFIDKHAKIGKPKQSNFKFSKLKGTIQFSFEDSKFRINVEKLTNKKTILISQSNAIQLAKWILSHQENASI